MINVNEYFHGKVKSLGFEDEESKATVGVMAPGNYEFSTSTLEIMAVISGSLHVKLPGHEKWQIFKPGQHFQIAAHEKFQIKTEQPTSYLCRYYKEN